MDGRDAAGGCMGGWMGGSVGCNDTWDGGMDKMARTHTHPPHSHLPNNTHTHPSTPTHPHPPAHPTHPPPTLRARTRARMPARRPPRARTRTLARTHTRTHARTCARAHVRVRARARRQEWLGEEWPQLRAMQGTQAMRETQGLPKALSMLAMLLHI